jgi:6-phosphogluconate dehydrogenase
MVPATAVDSVLGPLKPLLQAGDIVIDGGNSYYHNDIRRAGELKPLGINYWNCGTSGGVWQLERGYCLMMGGDKASRGHEEHADKLVSATRCEFGGHLEKKAGKAGTS